MILSVIVRDAAVYLDGVQMSGIDMSGVPDGVRAFQWYGDHGVVEYFEPANEQVTEMPAWADVLTARWQEAKAAKEREEAYFASVRAAMKESQ